MTYMTVKEIAEQLRVDPVTITAAIRRGDLKAVRVGRVYRVTPENLNTWLNREQQ